MDLEKIRNILKGNEKYIEDVYIYNELVNNHKLNKKILQSDINVKFLISSIKNFYLKELNGEIENPYMRFDLSFICEVASLYAEELLNDEDADLENLCSQTLIEDIRNNEQEYEY